MKRFVFIVLALTALTYFTGCGKKQQALEEMQEPMSMEALSKLPAEAPAPVETKAQPVQNIEPLLSQPVAAPGATLPAPTSSKPSKIEIQTALKNAGFYTGNIDGKIGPMTKKAIEEFQRVHNLKADGKVGPQTWAVLSVYLTSPVEVKAKKKR